MAGILQVYNTQMCNRKRVGEDVGGKEATQQAKVRAGTGKQEGKRGRQERKGREEGKGKLERWHKAFLNCWHYL